MNLEAVLRDYHMKNIFHHKNIEKYLYIVGKFIRDTKYRGFCAFNMPLEQGTLNVYFLGNHLEDHFQFLKGNCAYLNYNGYDIILCDVNFLADWRNAFPGPKRKFSMDYDDFEYVPNPELSEAEVRNLFSQSRRQLENAYSSMLDYFFTQWVLGHEIGHAALGHTPGRLVCMQDGSIQGNKLSQDLEREADLFAIDHIFNDEFTPYVVWFSLSQVVDSWFYAETGTSALDLVYKKEKDAFVEVIERSSTHPPFIVRVLDMINLLLEVYPTIDTTGYFQKLREKIRIVKRDTQPQQDKGSQATDCSYEV
jgi:hypothetical protein